MYAKDKTKKQKKQTKKWINDPELFVLVHLLATWVTWEENIEQGTGVTVQEVY